MTPKRLLIVFLVLDALCSMWQFYWGFDLLPTAAIRILTGLRILLIFVLMLAAARYRNANPSISSHGLYGLKWTLLVFLVVLLLGYGFFRGNYWAETVMDAYTYAAFACWLVLGRYDAVWQDMEKPMYVFFWVALVLVIIGFGASSKTVSLGMVMEQTAGIDRDTNTVAYRIRFLLDFWPVLFGLAYLRPRLDIWKIMGVCTPLAALALSVIFQFRGGTAQALMFVFMMVAVIPLFRRQIKPGSAVLILAGLAVTGSLLMKSTSYEKLVARFETRDTGGRFLEAEAVFHDFSLPEYAIGRGMGGYYTPPWDWGAGVREFGGEAMRFATHVGLVHSFIKGGIFLWLIYFSFYLPVFLPKPRGWIDNRYNAVALAALPVILASLAFGPDMVFESPMQIVMYGLLCARLGTPAYEQSEPDQVHTTDVTAYAGSASW